MNKVKNIVLMAISIMSIGTFSGIMYMYLKQPKMAYVRVPYLYDNFQYKKELQAELTNVLQSRKTILDSLELHLRILSGHLQNTKKPSESDITEFNDDKEKYLSKKQQFDEDDNDLSKRYADQIMKQLTQYVQDYSKENGYTYIIGAEGTGALMAADDKNDITNNVLAFINEKYKGKK